MILHTIRSKLLKVALSKPSYRQYTYKYVFILTRPRLGDLLVAHSLINNLESDPRVEEVLVPRRRYQTELISIIEDRNPGLTKIKFVSWWKLLSKNLTAQGKVLLIDLNHSIDLKQVFLIAALKFDTYFSVFKRGRWGLNFNDLPVFREMSQIGRDLPIDVVFLNTYRSKMDPRPLDQSRALASTDRTYFQLTPGNQIRQRNLVLVNIAGKGADRLLGDPILDLLLSHLQRNRIQAAVIFYAKPNHRIEDIVRAKDCDTLLFTNLHELIDLLMQARAVITIDTAIVHLAECLNCPIFGIYAGPREEYGHWEPRKNSKNAVFRLQDGYSTNLNEECEVKLQLQLGEFLDKLKHDMC